MLNWWGRVVYWTGWGLVTLIAKLMFRFKVEGGENVPPTAGVLICSNHVSHLDPPLIGIAFRRPVFHMAKRELFSVPLLLSYMRAIRTIIVDRGRGRQSLDVAVDYLNRGQAVVIFPEGTRSKTGRLMRGRSGAVIIAAQAGCAILPVAIIGSQHAMKKGSKLIKPVPVTVRIGEPYTLNYSGAMDTIPREFLGQATDELMQRLEKLLPADMRPTAEEKSAMTAASESGNGSAAIEEPATASAPQ